MEERRREGMRLLAKGVAQADVARQLGVSRTTALRWDRARTGKRGAAWRKRPLGRPPKLTDGHLRRLPALIGHDIPSQIVKAGRRLDLHPRPADFEETRQRALAKGGQGA